MSRHPKPAAGAKHKPQPAEPRHRFRNTIEQIHAHQPAAVLRALAADLRSRSPRP